MISRYLRRLDKLTPDNSACSYGGKRVMLLSGQSDYSLSELSGVQKNLLTLFAAQRFDPITTGFPFQHSTTKSVVKRTGLFLAAFRNTEQFIAALTNRHYQQLLAKHLQPTFASSGELVILCQSAGLHLLKQALPFLKLRSDLKITLFALGPVTWGKFRDSRFALKVIKGRGDWISRLLDTHSVDFWIPCHHLDYCQNPVLIEIIAHWLVRHDKH